MNELSSENVIIGLQNALESLRAGQSSALGLALKYKVSTVAENKFARARQQDRRVSHRRSAKLAHPAETGTTSHIAPPQQEREE